MQSCTRCNSIRGLPEITGYTAVRSNGEGVTDVKVKTTLTVLVVIVAISGVIWTLASMQTQVGVPKAIGAGKPAQDPAFLTVDPVSGTPTEWVSAVCRERVHQLPSDMSNPLRGIGFLYPNAEFELPGSTYSAIC